MHNVPLEISDISYDEDPYTMSTHTHTHTHTYIYMCLYMRVFVCVCVQHLLCEIYLIKWDTHL